MRFRMLLTMAAFAVLLVCPPAWGATTTLSSTLGTPGKTLTVTGTGFEPGTSVDVFFDTTHIAIATSTTSGTVSRAIAIPQDASPGQHWITLTQGSGRPAAQAGFFVRTDWPQQGFGPSGRRSNGFETTLNPSNVGNLGRAWSKFLNPYGNLAPVILFGGYLYTVDYAGTVRAFRTSGTLLWTASIGDNFRARPPVGYNGRVFFANDAGTVFAFTYNCRSDGGACTPAWSRSVGTSTTAPLVAADGVIYAPAPDKTIHALNPATGAEGTALPATTAFGTEYPQVTQAPVFTGDDSHFFAAGTWWGRRGPSGASLSSTPASVNPMSSLNGRVYFASNDGTLRRVSAGDRSVTGSAVFAAVCTVLGAFDPVTLETRWSTTVEWATGLAAANGVLYACAEGAIGAWDAVSGTRLWAGGPCSGQPIVANGTLYVTGNGRLDAYDLTGGRAARRGRRSTRPDPRRLRPDPAVRRRASVRRAR